MFELACNISDCAISSLVQRNKVEKMSHTRPFSVSCTLYISKSTIHNTVFFLKVPSLLALMLVQVQFLLVLQFLVAAFCANITVYALESKLYLSRLRNTLYGGSCTGNP